MGEIRIPSVELCTGRRRIEEIDFCYLLKDLEWNDSIKKWILHFRLTIPVGSQFINKETEWFVAIDDDYPLGTINFYPAMKNGIDVTFPHQMYNGLGKDASQQWLEGNICCKTPWGRLIRNGFDWEPTHASERLMWNFERAREWLVTASKNELLRPGDPFELPDFPKKRGNDLKTVVFSEDSDSMQIWTQINEAWGIVKLEEYETVRKHVFVKLYLSAKEKELYKPRYGSVLSSSAKNNFEGIWIKIHHLPVSIPWQVPNSWGELIIRLKDENIDFNEFPDAFFKRFRDGREHFLLLGFPIPGTFGGKIEQMHWQPIKMPILSSGKEKGFRPVEKSCLKRDFEIVFNKNKQLNWHHSENWNSGQISTRGRYPVSLLKLSVVLIGAGALGSMFGELMVRSGISNLSIIDYDTLEIGNLVRHTLDFSKIGESKAEALSQRLNLANPNAHVNANNISFSIKDEKIKKTLEGCHLVIDCTADNSVIDQLDGFHWQMNTMIASISIGMRAQRLFIYFATGQDFSAESFHGDMKEWLNKEKEEFSTEEFPWAGVGCWSPVFPARADDLWLMASVASKAIIDEIEKGMKHELLMVFEQQLDKGQFVGVKRIQ